MIIQKDFKIGDKTTWHVDVMAQYFVQIHNFEDLLSLVKSPEYLSCNKRYVIGSGANTLFANSYFDGIVIEICTKGYEKVGEDGDNEYWRIAAGEDWVSLVEWMVLQNNLGGLENLAYIPGKVGSAPIQNIAAYGCAFEDVCHQVEVVNLNSTKSDHYNRSESKFSYRGSLYKQMLIDTNRSIVVWSVILKLVKPSKHSIEADYFSNYESLHSELQHLGSAKPTIKDIFHAVVALRKKKLPDISQVGSNGSLFVNPIVTGQKLKSLIERFPHLQYYPTEKMKYVATETMQLTSDAMFKVAAGHIFDEIGWKGKRIGQVGTWQNHALVLCNYGTSDPKDILNVITMMQDDFESATGIRLTPEINIVY